MFLFCSSWPPVRVNLFRPFLSYMEIPWAPSHISKGVVGTGGSILAFLRGAMMHSMNFRTSKQNFIRKLFLMGGGHSKAAMAPRAVDRKVILRGFLRTTSLGLDLRAVIIDVPIIQKQQNSGRITVLCHDMTKARKSKRGGLSSRMSSRDPVIRIFDFRPPDAFLERYQGGMSAAVSGILASFGGLTVRGRRTSQK
jgi:hypothetical protein